jgi:RNA polymerase sigma-70 factor (ECF subfamily)
MASLTRLGLRANAPAREVAPELIKQLPRASHRLLFDSADRAPLNTGSPIGLRATASAARALETTSPSEPNRAERLGQRAPAHRLEAQFRALYDTHFQAVWSALSRLGVRDPDLMDVTQKVFFAAYLSMRRHDGRAPISTWLYGICRRLAAAYRRSAAIRCEIACDPVSLDASIERRAAAAGGLDPTGQVAVEQLLSKLNEKQRAVFILFAVVELSAPEVAALLDIPLETVRSRLRCGRERCRREARRLRLVSAFSKTQTSERRAH